MVQKVALLIFAKCVKFLYIQNALKAIILMSEKGDNK